MDPDTADDPDSMLVVPASATDTADEPASTQAASVKRLLLPLQFDNAAKVLMALIICSASIPVDRWRTYT